MLNKSNLHISQVLEDSLLGNIGLITPKKVIIKNSSKKLLPVLKGDFQEITCPEDPG